MFKKILTIACAGLAVVACSSGDGGKLTTEDAKIALQKCYDWSVKSAGPIIVKNENEMEVKFSYDFGDREKSGKVYEGKSRFNKDQDGKWHLTLTWDGHTHQHCNGKVPILVE